MVSLQKTIKNVNDVMRKLLLSLTLMLSLFCLDCDAFVRYVTHNLNLRYGPGTSYAVICVIPQGTAVSIDEDCDCKWVPVSYCGRVGYISTKYLTSRSTRQIARHNTPNRISTPSRHYSTSYSQTYKSRVRYYTNVDGYRVQSPTYYNSAPAGATALCRDGTYSFSRNRRGTCSHHGGVARWL